MKKRISRSACVALFVYSMIDARAQDEMSPSMYLMNLASGTAENPESWQMPMIMLRFGNWSTSLMGTGFLSDIQQSGPRGGDKLYSTSWFMSTAQHRFGNNGALEGVVTLSLEPATVTDRRYPLLFQTGETAYGVPLADAQHPHNFVMELGVHYVRALAENLIFDLYLAPVGDPALGPVAFPHRASAMDFPEAPISHHWQDSTHVADDVITAGVRYKKIKAEASGFYGSEPGENRWTIGAGPINSWSSRVSYFPSANWAAQVSAGRLTHPEALEPGDQTRVTASLECARPMSHGTWASTLSWGRTHNTATLRNLNSYMVETSVPVTRRDFVNGRVERVDKDELFSSQPELEQFLDSHYGSTFRIGAYTAGYIHDFDLFGHVETGIGANFTAYSLPGAIKPYYGNHPVGANIFIRFRLKQRG